MGLPAPCAVRRPKKVQSQTANELLGRCCSTNSSNAVIFLHSMMSRKSTLCKATATTAAMESCTASTGFNLSSLEALLSHGWEPEPKLGQPGQLPNHVAQQLCRPPSFGLWPQDSGCRFIFTAYAKAQERPSRSLCGEIDRQPFWATKLLQTLRHGSLAGVLISPKWSSQRAQPRTRSS